jgi:hypothetical protein
MSFDKTNCLIVSFPCTINYKFVAHLREHTTYPKKEKKFSFCWGDHATIGFEEKVQNFPFLVR